MSKIISVDFIQENWEVINSLSEKDAENIVNDLGEEQPFLLAYLVGTGEGDLDEAESEFLLYVGIVLWQIFRTSGGKLKNINEDTLDKFGEINIKMLEYLETESENYFFDFVENLVSEYPQPNMLQFITELTFDEEEEIRDKNRGIMFIYLKIVVDCLNEASKK